jgi:hypothetical protein
MKSFFTTLIFLLILFFPIRSFASEIYEVTSDVFVRSGVGTSFEAIGVAKMGDLVKVLDKSNSNWFKIEFDEKIGYISSKFVKLIEPVVPKPIEEVALVEEEDSNSFAGVLILFFVLFLIIEISRRSRKKRIASSIQKFQGLHPELYTEKKNIKVVNDSKTQIEPLSIRKENILNSVIAQKGLDNNKVLGLKKNSSEPKDYKKAEKVMTKAPFWTERFIFSPAAIENASEEQKSFYSHFKQKFIDNVFLDLNGNNNYAFVLLQDLLIDYETHLNIAVLETQIFNLCSYYSKTKSYANGYLNKIKLEIVPQAQEHSDEVIMHTSGPILEQEVEDESIIDVTSDTFTVTPIPKKEEPISVPTWSHKYVYSKSDLNSATIEQKVFYNHFKQKFLNGTSLDILGNTNYAFVLLFDLLDEYRNHQKINMLESQINNLGNNYYKTRSYGIRFLNEIKKELGLIPSLASNYQHSQIGVPPSETKYYDSEPDYFYWKLGSKYKDTLGLKDEEVTLLNKLWESTTNFCGIEFCYFQVMRLYLDSIASFTKQCEKSGTNLEEEFLVASDLISRKIFRYRKGSANYKMSVKNTSDEFYTAIFKLCENALREHYGHRRKLSTEIRYSDPLISEQFEAKILLPFSSVIGELVMKIPEPDEATQKELNALNTSRWKDEFQKLCEGFSCDENKFVAEILDLGELNSKNPSIENIFYESSKFMASKHKESSLILYLHYLHHDLKSAKFDNKQLTKTIQKSLFKTQEQVQKFEIIVNNLLKEKDLKKAVSAVSKVYTLIRKRIKLDRNSIDEVRQQHAGTVELLNQYLQDEEVELASEFEGKTSEQEEIEIQIDSSQKEKSESFFMEEIEFKPIHYSALELFAKNNFTIPISDFELFAKSNGVFRNQLIESINEACYEVLDDVLIEEEEDFYTIEAMYFQTITTNNYEH